MSRLHLFGAAVLLLAATSAPATSFVVTTDTTVDALDATTDVTSSPFRDDKIVRAAHADAASFVASDGAIRGARLEAALAHIRSQLPQLNASDMQLAQAILAL
ncbi:DUF2388 domain-containing protein [Azotobacter salinestris]|uniref:DUF2388 domain-containing protein n=1 Tax=Azotobacter salinestris TaxID=69964 RepID=UPI0012669495|nr:DUF2388 domain-containing protein [Azotobacter salinestris]